MEIYKTIEGNFGIKFGENKIYMEINKKTYPINKTNLALMTRWSINNIHIVTIYSDFSLEENLIVYNDKIEDEKLYQKNKKIFDEILETIINSNNLLSRYVPNLNDYKKITYSELLEEFKFIF